jgi:hypothetical protein
MNEGTNAPGPLDYQENLRLVTLVGPHKAQ